MNNLSTKSKSMFSKGISNLGRGAMKLSQFSGGAKMVGDIANQASQLIDPSKYSGSAGQVLDTGIERAKKLQKTTNKLIKYTK